MPSREYYLQQAKLIFDMAAATSDKAVAARLIARANEYQMLAAAIPAGVPPPVQAPGTVLQPMQQQQQQQQPKDDKDGD